VTVPVPGAGAFGAVVVVVVVEEPTAVVSPVRGMVTGLRPA
jgi:hypothetical protein